MSTKGVFLFSPQEDITVLHRLELTKEERDKWYAQSVPDVLCQTYEAHDPPGASSVKHL